MICEILLHNIGLVIREMLLTERIILLIIVIWKVLWYRYKYFLLFGLLFGLFQIVGSRRMFLYYIQIENFCWQWHYILKIQIINWCKWMIIKEMWSEIIFSIQL